MDLLRFPAVGCTSSSRVRRRVGFPTLVSSSSIKDRPEADPRMEGSAAPVNSSSTNSISKPHHPEEDLRFLQWADPR